MKEETPEEHEVIPYAEAKKLGIVKGYREFKRRYLGFANGREHLLADIRRFELDEDATDEEVEEFIAEELITMADGGMIHYFASVDEPFKPGPIEQTIMEELDRF